MNGVEINQGKSMTAKLLRIEQEICPAAKLIGKKYDTPNWGEWWQNGWFEQLEVLPVLPFNGDSYIGASRSVNGKTECWIGMLFPENSPVPHGFDSVDMPQTAYAVCYLYGSETGGELYSSQTKQMCLLAVQQNVCQPDETGWRLERYNCPRFTSPDENGMVILDFCVSIKG